MACEKPSEYGLRPRDDPGELPLAQQSSKVRGLRAAFDILKGNLTPRSAKKKYQVGRHAVKYYKAKLLKDGFETVAKPAAATAGSQPPTGEEAEKEAKAQKTEAWDEYCKAYVFAGELIKEGVSKRAAAQQASDKYRVDISPSTALRAAERPGQLPAKPGRQLFLGEVMEHRLEMLCLVLREMRIPIFQCMVLNYANALIRGTEKEELFKHGEIRRHWYYHWLGRCSRLKTGNIRPLEITRAKWATARNALTHYEQLAEILVDLGLAVRNASFSEDEELSEPIKITKPGRIFSMDETRLTNDTTQCSKAKNCRSILAKDGDCGEVLVNKGGGDGTGIGGTSADGLDIPGFFIFSNNIIHAGEDDKDVAEENRPVCRRPDPNNPDKPLPCRFWANEKGGMNSDLGIRYIKGCIEPCLSDLSPASPAVIIMDGHGSHFTLELLDYCRSIGLHIVLRPPHTTHVLQGEDVEHFGVFKPMYQQKKMLLMGSRVFSGKTRLSAGDLLLCAKEAWERAFDLEHSLKAWAKIGVSPFNRCVFWELRKAEDQRAKVALSAQCDPAMMTIEGMVSILFPEAAQARQQEQGGQDGEGGERPPARGQKRRSECNLHSTDLWDRPGGATGDECFAIVKAKTAARRAKDDKAKQAKEARAEARKEKHASANELGAAICIKLTAGADVLKLKVAELKAALVYKGVAVDPKLKKSELSALLARELRGSGCSNYSASFVADPSAEVEPTAADFVDSSDDAASDCGSVSSEWPHSEADDH